MDEHLMKEDGNGRGGLGVVVVVVLHPPLCFSLQRTSNLSPFWEFSIMFLHALLLLHVSAVSSSISCQDDQGTPVDWFYLYKLPHLPRQPVEDGLKYIFMEGQSEGWIDGKTLLNDTRSAVGRTVGPLYEGGEVGYVLYNDQPPDQELSGAAGGSCGHTKGVLVFDKQQGFWLVHSTPHFPPPNSAGQYSYPHSGASNGQNFICVTYPFERFQTIVEDILSTLAGTVGEQLKINQPHVYDCSVPVSLASAVPALSHLCKQSEPKLNSTSSSLPSNRSVSLLSLTGTEFISFAKGASFSSGERITFKATEDHSKWAVSTRASSGWVCVGDINRDKAEENRGGGTVCRKDDVVWKAYRTAALQCQSCGGETQSCEQDIL
ncbi:hypothetical protein DNTS_005489 [Danionella cerebrum]|uniref:Deoxyribonuclease-2-alpha n=1 Tax=Danionella cerebrum TaxID=2873325 RepID=A0A553PYG5_9TELE|nr:hypothetical protein DNTS_005489 [Danionella translucida]